MRFGAAELDAVLDEHLPPRMPPDCVAGVSGGARFRLPAERARASCAPERRRARFRCARARRSRIAGRLRRAARGLRARSAAGSRYRSP